MENVAEIPKHYDEENSGKLQLKRPMGQLLLTEKNARKMAL
jgi:hypothetical protein